MTPIQKLKCVLFDADGNIVKTIPAKSRKTVAESLDELGDHDWKEIATVLARAVMFAAKHDTSPGEVFGNDRKIQSKVDYYCDALESVPGLKIDREMLGVIRLPKSKYKAALKKLEAQRAKEKDTHGG
ncbi:MAG: hypothetical protein JJT75_15005 [Opitutales bacterium]|nr:hypothetical protein [Opitutales bacterium]